eukprot:3487042-Rhodomonas_salina.1
MHARTRREQRLPWMVGTCPYQSTQTATSSVCGDLRTLCVCTDLGCIVHACAVCGTDPGRAAARSVWRWTRSTKPSSLSI